MSARMPWLELDCPHCGIDNDFHPDPGDTVICSCGHVFTEAEIADANHYDAEGNCINSRNVDGRG